MANKLVNEESLEKKLWKAADKLRKNMDAAEFTVSQNAMPSKQYLGGTLRLR